MNEKIIQLHLFAHALRAARESVSPLMQPIHDWITDRVIESRNAALFDYGNSGVSHRQYFRTVRYLEV